MDPTKIDALKEGSPDHPHRFATCKFSVSRTRGAPRADFVQCGHRSCSRTHRRQFSDAAHHPAPTPPTPAPGPARLVKFRTLCAAMSCALCAAIRSLCLAACATASLPKQAVRAGAGRTSTRASRRPTPRRDFPMVFFLTVTPIECCTRSDGGAASLIHAHRTSRCSASGNGSGSRLSASGDPCRARMPPAFSAPARHRLTRSRGGLDGLRQLLLRH